MIGPKVVYVAECNRILMKYFEVMHWPWLLLSDLSPCYSVCLFVCLFAYLWTDWYFMQEINTRWLCPGLKVLQEVGKLGWGDWARMNARLKPRCYVITLGSYWLTHITPHSFQMLRHTIWLSYSDWLKTTITSDLGVGRTSLYCFTHFMLASIVYSHFSAVLPNSSMIHLWHMVGPKNICRWKGFHKSLWSFRCLFQ